MSTWSAEALLEDRTTTSSGSTMRRSRSFSGIRELSARNLTSVQVECEETSSNATKWGNNRARNRKKSRRLTPTYTGSQELPAGSEKDQSKTVSESQAPASTSDNRERKISRIFQMLQSMQQTFLQNVNPPVSSVAPAESGVFPGATKGISPLQQHQPQQRLHHNYLSRVGSVNSWAGSDYSDSSLISSTASSVPPLLVHPMPYHKDGWTSFFIVGSSLYAELLIVLCVVSALTEVISHNVPIQYYEGFYTYLYTVSITFYLYVFGYLLRNNKRSSRSKTQNSSNQWRSISHRGSLLIRRFLSFDNDPSLTNNGDRESESQPGRTSTRDEVLWVPDSPTDVTSPYTIPTITEGEVLNSTSPPVFHARNLRKKTKKTKVSVNEHSHGSFFLRAGAVAFGLGTMIYDGLEFGAFLEIPVDSPCYVLLRGINPVLHATFVFLQMYFVFVSARLIIHRFKALARFGLMHCLATNVCVWIRTLVRESLKEINEHYNHKEHTNDHHYDELHDNESDHSTLWDLTGNVSCGRKNLLGDVIMNATPFLYPFLIEYSLIGAAVVYVIWAHVGLNPKYIRSDEEETEHNIHKKHMRIDCLGASRGLFLGLFLLAVSLLCIVLFFVFAPQQEFRILGLVLADGVHCALLLISLVAMGIGVFRVKDLQFHPEHTEDMANILLRVSALGIFIYSVFSIVAGALSPWSDEPPLLVLVNGILSVVQVIAQMLFISDISRRRVCNEEQNVTKPGRQTVTFLLLLNITLWLVYTFEMQKVEANPVQLNFYGFLPWAVVQRITLPLCIFYRFHSAIHFAEIWKNTYRFNH